MERIRVGAVNGNTPATEIHLSKVRSTPLNLLAIMWEIGKLGLIQACGSCKKTVVWETDVSAHNILRQSVRLFPLGFTRTSQVTGPKSPHISALLHGGLHAKTCRCCPGCTLTWFIRTPDIFQPSFILYFPHVFFPSPTMESSNQEAQIN